MNHHPQHSMRRSLSSGQCATLNAQGLFEVVLISEGHANGWNFSARVLQDSLKLWDGAECFIDHQVAWAHGQSVRNLCGVFYDITYDPDLKGVKGTLKTLGPSGTLAAQLGKEWLTEAEPRPAIGFSADIGFIASNTTQSETTQATGRGELSPTRDVLEITHVYSCDLVFEPARGGAFIRALNSVQENSTMGDAFGIRTYHPDSANPPIRKGGNGDMEGTHQDLDTARALSNVQPAQTQAAAEHEAARQVRLQMCAYLLDSGLSASRLPAAAQERVRKQFAGKLFDPADLQAEIDDARKLVSELVGGNAVAGLKHVSHAMFNSDDQVTAAVEDLFGVERSAHLQNAKPARLSGIRELYLGLTGDIDFYGGADPARAMFQSTTATFPGLVKNAMNRALVERWKQLGRAGYDWWEKIVHVEHFNDVKQITWLIFGTVASLPTVAEGGEYTELVIGDGAETSSFTKYGGYVA